MVLRTRVIWHNVPHKFIEISMETPCWYLADKVTLVKTSNCTSKDHRDKIKVPDPVVKDLISSKL